MKNGKNNFGFLYRYKKYGKFWSVSSGNFIKHKPPYFWRVLLYGIYPSEKNSQYQIEFYPDRLIILPFFSCIETVEVLNNDGGKRLLEIVEIKRPPGFKPSQEIFRETTTTTTNVSHYIIIFSWNQRFVLNFFFIISNLISRKKV